MTDTDTSDGTDQDYEHTEFEQKMDELNDGLLEAYAAGFEKCVETFGLQPDFDTSVEALKQNERVREAHYYFWDGKTKPLELWLKDEFGVSAETVDSERVNAEEGKLDHVVSVIGRGHTLSAGRMEIETETGDVLGIDAARDSLEVSVRD